MGEFLIDLNGTRAYRVAFPGSGYATARMAASRLVAQDNIAAEIRAARCAQSRRTRIGADRVLREIARIAFADVLDLFDADGRPRPVGQIPHDTRRAITAVKMSRARVTTRVTRNGRTRTATTTHESVLEYKFCNKVDALEKLCRYLGLRTEIAPLDALLMALPPTLAGQIRQALVESLPPAAR